MRELFYSNGVDIFGPVSLEEFSRNRYYKSTLIWYEGLPGWVNIDDCVDLRHLIGSMATPSVDNPIPTSLPNLTPPLDVPPINQPAKRSNRKYVFIAAALLVILVGLVTVYFNSKNKPAESTAPPVVSDTTSHKDTIVTPVDSNALREAAIKEIAAKAEEKKVYRKNWEKFIMAKPNDYTQREIGGIDDLKIIVSNNTPYKIETVKVKVAYIKANGEAYQHEIMEFDNIESNENKELYAPKSDRGVKVTCTIISVNSSEMNFCIDKEDKHFKKKKGEDPFQCQKTAEAKK